MAWFAFIFILGAAVILHEFGHFIVAKMLGIRVETFSVGFGKRLWGRRWGTTDYRLSLIPLGGYVKLGGDESNAGLEEGGAEEIPAGERFDLRPRWQKFLVGVAGPVMNVLTALAIPFVFALTIGVPATPPPVVKTVYENGAAQKAGIQKGDRILSLNGHETDEWERIEHDAALLPDQPVPVVVERGGERVSLTITPTKQVSDGETYGRLGILPDYGNIPIVIVEVSPNMPAAEVGLKPDDQLLTIGGEDVDSSDQVRKYIREHPDQPINIAVKRGGERLEFTAQTKNVDGQNLLGVVPSERLPMRHVGVGEAVSYSFSTNIEILRLTGMALGQVFSGQRSVRETFSGPIGIAQASKRAAEQAGLEGVFQMLGFLSLNLGIFNLLPIPVLDGGMIFMLLIEGVLALMGLKLSMTIRERIQQVGFVFLLLLMGFVIINDVTKFVPGWFGSKEKPAATQQK